MLSHGILHQCFKKRSQEDHSSHRIPLTHYLSAFETAQTCQRRPEGQLASEQKPDTSTLLLPRRRLPSLSSDLLLPQWKEMDRLERGLPTATLWGFLHSSLIKVPFYRRGIRLPEVKQPDRVQGHECAPGWASASTWEEATAASPGT